MRLKPAMITLSLNNKRFRPQSFMRQDSGIDLSNYSYLEYQFMEQQSRLSPLPLLDSHSFEPLIPLLQQCKPRLTLSHSAVHSQLQTLQQTIKASFDSLKVFDLGRFESFEAIKSQPIQDTEASVVIASIFGLKHERFLPALSHLICRIRPLHSVKFIIYCHSYQEKFVSDLADRFNQPFMPVSFYVPCPFEVSQAPIMAELKKFLVEESKQDHKMDVVLFHPPTETLSRDIHHMLRTEGILPTVQIINGPHQALNPELSNLLIANEVQDLRDWNYDLSQVYLVLDSGRQDKLYYDFSYGCYTEDKGVANHNERVRRMNLINCKIGQYILDEEAPELASNQDSIALEELTLYCLSLAYFETDADMQGLPQQQTLCLNALRAAKVCVEENKCLKLRDGRIFEYAWQGIHPVFALMLLQLIEKGEVQRIRSCILIQSILIHPSLRPHQQEYRPSGIWRQSGYLHSCLDLIRRVQILQARHKAQQLSQGHDDELSFEKLATKYCFDVNVYEAILKEAKRIEDLLSIEQRAWEPMEKEEFNELLEFLLGYFKSSLAFNSGSRRLGYFQKGKQQGVLAHKESLMSLLNERPSFVLLTRLAVVEEGRKEIMTCNYVEDEMILSAYGALPITSKQSFGECEISFHDVTSSIFAHLSKYNCLQLENFEKENECSVELNEELSSISIQCSKLKEKTVEALFSKLLEEVKGMYRKETKIVKYSNTLKVLIGAGGEIKNLSVKESEGDSTAEDTCVVSNLDPEVDLADLKDLIDQFVQTKEIEIVNKLESNEAIISFYSFEDYKTFNMYFQNCNYLGRVMIINPYVVVQKQINPEKYLLFEWNQWKSKCEAVVCMEEESCAKQVALRLKSLNYQPNHKANKVYVSGLSAITDERDLQMIVAGCGKIAEIEVLRYYSGNAVEEDHIINKILSDAFKGDEIVYTVGNLNKGKNGYRSKKVVFQKDEVMKEAYFLMNQIVGRIGTGKLYATPIFTYPIKLPNDSSYIPVYKQLIMETSEDLNRPKPIQMEVICEREMKYLIVKANEEAEIDVMVNMISEKLLGVDLNINMEDKSLLFSDFSLKKIMDLEEKFTCKLIPNLIQKKIKCLARAKSIPFIEKQINTKFVESFSYAISLNNNVFKILESQFPSIVSSNAVLGAVKYEFEDVAKVVILSGTIPKIDKARDQIARLVKQMKKSTEESIQNHEDYCGLCCEQYSHPFKLQACGHKFCFDCLQAAVRVTLRDITMYPVKCPECMEALLLSDLNCLMTEGDWKDMIKMSVNHFVFSHPGQYTFCYTVSCPQINHIEGGGKWFRCRECKKGYCLECKSLYHPGMSCEEARYGSERLFKDYMMQSGGRICANKKCRSPIVRVDGCFKVQCTRCLKCMCFKCPEKSMVAYDTPQETYAHLEKMHGGCF